MSSDPLIGKKLGGYRIVEKIGQGGMADIYKGRRSRKDEFVAIKLVGQHLAADAALTRRFRREARAAASLNHPHIITVYDYGEYGGGHYMVMEYIAGTNLQKRIKYRYARGRGFKPQEVVTLIEQIASALDFAHKKGVVHRDVKPANILLSRDRGAVLTDFGLVMLRDRVSQQTRGESFGTPEYIAPEQAIDSRAATLRSDVYSLGVLLYELTTGQLPFDADSAISLALLHIGEEPDRPRKHAPKLPLAVEAVILRAMAKQPSKRYASAGALARALRKAYGDRLSAPAPARSVQRRKSAARPKTKKSSSRSRTARRPSRRRAKRQLDRRLLAAGLVVLLLLLAVGAFLLTRKGDTAPTATSSASQAVPESSDGLSAGAQKLRPLDEMPMRFVPAGVFLMGSPDDDPDARPHERPQHSVELSPFWLDQTEVSNDQYRLCVQAGACPAPVVRTSFDDPALADHPVVYVTWDHAAAYCAWLADETDWPVALPTEAQWEKAAAWDPATEGHRRYPWGDASPTDEHANLATSGLGRTAAVGSYPQGASFYGLLDLSGNVWEWVADRYDKDYYATSDLPPDPGGPSSGSQHVMRGGSYGFGAVEARTAHRTAGGPQAAGVGLGFRCAVNARELP